MLPLAILVVLPQGEFADRAVPQRAPLAVSPFVKLPTGSIRAKGWLEVQLKLQRDGFSGRLTEISGYLNSQDNAWLGNTANPRAGWEELPYWLKGQVSLAYVLNDGKLIEQCRPWIDAILGSQKPDGWFGPEANRTGPLGTPDLWPNMLAQSVLQTYYEATGDNRVLDLMKRYVDWLVKRYVDWLAKLPTKDLVDPRHYWHFYRVGDQLSSLVWLYNHTGYTPILSLAPRLHQASAKWVDGIVNRHGVNFAQGLREPTMAAVFSKQSRDAEASERNLRQFLGEYGLPAGMYAADENARPGKDDPRQATETCSVAEMMLSGEQIMLVTGKPIWGDRVEEIAFNWLPATMTADLKALRYLTSGNMAVSDATGHSPGIENGGPMFLMDPHDHRCCQHNVGMAWPMFTEHLWFGVDGGGLAAAMYAPSEVSARVGGNTPITIESKTDYPFSSTIAFSLKPARAVRFPLWLRVPGWCAAPRVAINGKTRTTPITNGFLVLDRTWEPGDTVALTLPMAVKTRAWPQHGGAVSIERGPLTYSLRIAENPVRHGRSDAWPSYEIRPRSNWNFGLEGGPKAIRAKVLRPGTQPWTASTVPISMTIDARRIPEWGLDMYGLVGTLQASPARTTDPKRQIELIPMGAARLRITVFPTVSATGGTKWEKRPQPVTPIPAR